PDGIVQLELVQSLFHSGKLSTRSRGLMEVEGSGALRVNPQDAARFALKDGDRVRLSNVRGEMTTTVTIRARVPQGTAWFPDHFGQTAAHLFECTIDPVTRTPSIRATAVSMMKVA
ncbi:MAG: NADH dehydrogenase (quinone) subunit G, partial [Nitrospira sp.]|nr:NADH dehydrogenase (quinone) subunit G [Nitrospira sp.]